MRPLVYSDTITIRTDADLRRAIAAAAQREGASASEWVRRALGTIVGSNDTHPPFPPAAPAAMRVAA
ncbi:toxin-antitoxin system HicB family antitoxin [Methylobacterium sp. J-088]|uniref:toxin-antitoxin system HicB family antitoxin n=1 Tax=Methylobacterium sp. J-088 TaxID=2836664 RepID=UPI001FBA9312|nr:toxin-antitoxin system HicB family antitoxin [Methylobacterium sp. J-088]MCJ2061895.1 toxin-antitoxin system HicB family antitoxin [Methylobacterium sp. J-088]